MGNKGKGTAYGQEEASSGLTPMNPNAAGIDVGSESHFVAVPADRDQRPDDASS